MCIRDSPRPPVFFYVPPPNNPVRSTPLVTPLIVRQYNWWGYAHSNLSILSINQSIRQFLKWPKWCSHCKDHYIYINIRWCLRFSSGSVYIGWALHYCTSNVIHRRKGPGMAVTVTLLFVSLFKANSAINRDVDTRFSCRVMYTWSSYIGVYRSTTLIAICRILFCMSQAILLYVDRGE